MHILYPLHTTLQYTSHMFNSMQSILCLYLWGFHHIWVEHSAWKHRTPGLYLNTQNNTISYTSKANVFHDCEFPKLRNLYYVTRFTRGGVTVQALHEFKTTGVPRWGRWGTSTEIRSPRGCCSKGQSSTCPSSTGATAEHRAPQQKKTRTSSRSTQCLTWSNWG